MLQLTLPRPVKSDTTVLKVPLLLSPVITVLTALLLVSYFLKENVQQVLLVSFRLGVKRLVVWVTKLGVALTLMVQLTTLLKISVSLELF
jgi:hypothetical protein